MNWLESQIETRTRKDLERTERAYAKLAASVGNSKQAPLVSEDDIEQIVCLKHCGVQAGEVPPSVKNVEERVDWLCRPTGTMRRKVRLTEGWQNRAFGAMLGSLDTGEPIALIPRGVRGYYYRQPGTSRKIRVTREVAKHVTEDAELFYGIDLSQDRRWTSIGVCGKRWDGGWHIEVAARRVGTEWAIDWFRQRAMRGRMKLAFQSRGAPVSGLAEQICTIQGVERIAIEGAELSNGWGRFYDGIAASAPASEDGEIRGGVPIHHLPQPVLDAPGKTMQLRKMGGGVDLPDRVKSPDDIAPLFACIMAYTAATRPVPAGKIYESSYANGGSLTFI